MKKLAKWVLVILSILLVGFAVRLFKPWDDLQSWRWYTLALESSRADLFTHWEVIQPHSQLLVSSRPRVYRRNTRALDQVTYEFEGQPIRSHIISPKPTFRVLWFCAMARSVWSFTARD